MMERLAPLRAAVDEKLAALASAEPSAPPGILEAVRYALLGPGKRLRPTLLLACGEAAGGRRDELLEPACAVEMIHAFSLVHDDLPALDDDDLRRGRPTLHVKFGEATAILAGDALLNMAFAVLAAYPEGPGFAIRKLAVIGEISRAVGLGGMIGGQVLDLEFEGKKAGAEELDLIHRMKTGALITAACTCGGILAGAGEGVQRALRAYGSALGLAFQITDDILDVEGTAQAIGKSPGKDAATGKTTFPGVWGMDASRKLAAEKVDEAVRALSPLGPRAGLLQDLARGVATRTR